MSDLERPYLSREPSGPPSSCPVCGAATSYFAGGPVITCRSAGLDHFEWWPAEQRRAHVVSERADEWKCSWCRGHNPAIETRCGWCGIERTEPAEQRRAHVVSERVAGKTCPEANDAPCSLADDNPGCCIRDHQPAVEASADNDRYDKSSTSPHSPPEVEGWKAMLHLPGCPALNYSGDCSCPPVPVGTPYPRPDDVVVIEAEVLGVDYRTACASRLGGNAGRLAALHRPVYGRPPYCWACSSPAGQRRVDSSRRAVWPCTTASMALAMMDMAANDIAITENQ